MLPNNVSVRDWAQFYAANGLAIARILHGKKRPSEKKWTVRSRRPEEFRSDDSIGLMTGALSGHLVCVDLDSRDALQLADRMLPSTKMEEGRPGKLRSHRYYRIINLAADLLAPSSVAGGAGGPAIRRFKRPDRVTLVDFLGTGTHAVAPPSFWTNKDGSHWERRAWHVFEEPAVVDHRELFDAVVRLVSACGYRPKQDPKPRGRRPSCPPANIPPTPPMPTGAAARQARAYIRGIPAAVSGQGGDAQTFRVACVLVRDFGLHFDDAWALLLEYNHRCMPPWTAKELLHKLKRADAWDGPRGRRVLPVSLSA